MGKLSSETMLFEGGVREGMTYVLLLTSMNEVNVCYTVYENYDLKKVFRQLVIVVVLVSEKTNLHTCF